jgi:hypothetical protein
VRVLKTADEQRKGRQEDKEDTAVPSQKADDKLVGDLEEKFPKFVSTLKEIANDDGYWKCDEEEDDSYVEH